RDRPQMTEAEDGTDTDADREVSAEAAVLADADQTTVETDQTEGETADGSSNDAAAPPVKSGLLLSIAIAAVVVILDQITKRWALNTLAHEDAPRHVIWTLQFNFTTNSGMAFSRGQGIGPYIGAVAFVVVVVMLLSLRRAGRGISSVAVGLVVGGAVGNLTDRMFRGSGWLRGHVIDFIDLKWWPVFNVADMGVTIGGVLLVLAAAFDARSHRP
ncbi:MAG TPA: signal peptidase II, partial [Ilumatobacteraceae bacterium]